MNQTCAQCRKSVEQWNKRCKACGFVLVLEPDATRRARALRAPSLGALLFTQGWTFGARLYIWFLISLIPVLGLVALVACAIFGRRWSWKYGAWQSWDDFTRRMRLLDGIAFVWVGILVVVYLWARQ
jgi:hypothetical protein